MSSKEEAGLAIIRHINPQISFVSEAWCRGLDYQWYLDFCKAKGVKPVKEETFNELYKTVQEGYEENCEKGNQLCGKQSLHLECFL